MLALVDSFDRKLLRDKFIEIAELAMTFKDALARSAVVSSIDELYRAGDLTQKELDNAIEALARTAERNRLNLLDAMVAVASCPITGDTIN